MRSVLWTLTAQLSPSHLFGEHEKLSQDAWQLLAQRRERRSASGAKRGLEAREGGDDEHQERH